MPQPREHETACRRCGKNRTWAWDAICEACTVETHQTRVERARGLAGRRAQLAVALDPTGYGDPRIEGWFDEWRPDRELERADREWMRSETDRG